MPKERITTMNLYLISYYRELPPILEHKHSTYQAGQSIISALCKFLKRTSYGVNHQLTIGYVKKLKDVHNWQTNSVIFL